MDEETRAQTEYENSPSDPLHRKIRALRLPDYPDVRIRTNILTEYCDKIQMRVYEGSQSLCNVLMNSDDLEEMDLMSYFTQVISRYKNSVSRYKNSRRG